MGVSYKKLWKLLIDRDKKKIDLQKDLGISPSTLSRMTKGSHVDMAVLEKICTYFNVTLDEIVEFTKPESE